VQLDLEAESAELHSAMQASLTEEEQRKSAEVPLEQRPPEALAEHFKASLLLPKVHMSSRRCCSTLDADVLGPEAWCSVVPSAAVGAW
jgi:hypothetical protein